MAELPLKLALKTVNEVDGILLTPPGIIAAWKAGQIQYDPSCLCHLMDTGINDVRVNIGQECMCLVYNDTASIIDNGKVCYATGVDPTEQVMTIDLADNSSFDTAFQTIGIATHDIQIGELGLVTARGTVRNFDTSSLSAGLVYLGTNGNLTTTQPTYPKHRVAMGVLLKTGVLDGKFQVQLNRLPRRSASGSYSFTSADAAAGIHYRAGFYDWSTTEVALTQGSLSVTHGVADVSRAAHIGIVPQAAGTVDTGQVGLQVTGTLDSETGVQVAAQTAVITDDITTLTADTMQECIEKFSGTVTIALYIVSGSPTAYSLTFNYGYSKYEDFANIDATIIGFNATWEAGANDSSFNVTLLKHAPGNWTYAATGFEPGDGFICDRLTDQQINPNLSIGEEGSYKRVNLNEVIDGSEKEGVLIKIVTNAPNTIRSMDLRILALDEGFD